MKQIRITTFLSAMIVAISLQLTATAQTPLVVYSDIVSSVTSDVPGLAGAKFSSFDRPYRSLNGNFWIFSADTDLATAMDEVIVLGSGLSGTVVVQEGVTQVAPPSPELAGLIDRNLFVTNNGDFAYATNTDGATTVDEVIGRRFGGVFDVPAREGDAAPGIPGVTLGTSNHSAYIADDGRVGFVSSSLGGAATAQNAAVFFGSGVVAQKGVTVPTGQAGGATNTWELFDTDDVYFANNGATHLIMGDTNAATTEDDILVYNGAVVLQEGSVIAGSGFANPIDSSGIVESLMTPDGTWFARGNNVGEQDWLVRNGLVLAARGDAVPGGLPGEAFDDGIFADTFFSMTGNNTGDYVYGGVTNAVDVNANAVLVFNNSSVLVREGDGVDLNGNGLADDNAFISVFNNEDAFLTDDLRYYFTADLRDGAGTALGQAFLVVNIPEPAVAMCMVWIGVLLLRWRSRA